MYRRITQFCFILFVLSLASLAFSQAYEATAIKVPHLVQQGPLNLWVNDSGQVVGSRFAVNGNVKQGNMQPLTTFECCEGFYWSKSTGVVAMGSLGGNLTAAYAINDSGVATGWSYTANQASSEAYLWTLSGGFQDLGFEECPFEGGGHRINSASQIIGLYCTGINNQYPFIWSQSTGMQTFGTLPNGGYPSFASAINDNGQVVGQAVVNDQQYVFLWSEATGMQGILGYDTWSQASDINDNGQVVGIFYDADGTIHAFLWSASQGMQDLGSMDGCCQSGGPTSINNNGQIVGMTATGLPFLWSAPAGMQNLQDLVPEYVHITAVTTINNFGQVLTFGQKPTAIYLLTPKMATSLSSSENPSQVGDPVTFTATVSSIAGPPPNGENITFTADNKVIGEAPLSNGTATFTTSSLAKGSHSIQATYPGDAVYASSKSSVLKQVVQ